MGQQSAVNLKNLNGGSPAKTSPQDPFAGSTHQGTLNYNPNDPSDPHFTLFQSAATNPFNPANRTGGPTIPNKNGGFAPMGGAGGFGVGSQINPNMFGPQSGQINNPAMSGGLGGASAGLMSALGRVA